MSTTSTSANPANPANLATRLPQIPAHFTKSSSWQSALYLSYAVGLFLLPGLLTYLSASLPVHWLIKAPLVFVCAFVAAQGLFMLGVTGHEGFHFTLHENRIISAMLGIFFSSAIPLHTALGFAVNHWDHHRFTNTDQDPDIPVMRHFQSFLHRLLAARMYVNRKYMKLTLGVLRKDSASKELIMGLTVRQLKGLCYFNLLTQVIWLSSYISLIYLFPQQMLWILGVPILMTMGVSGLNHYYEHAGTTLSQFGKARSRISPLHTILMGGTNFHLEHHLFPRVPCWRLPALHRYLQEQGVYAGKETFFETRYLGSFLSIDTDESMLGESLVGKAG